MPRAWPNSQGVNSVTPTSANKVMRAILFITAKSQVRDQRGYHQIDSVYATNKFKIIAVFCCWQLADATIARPERCSQSIEDELNVLAGCARIDDAKPQYRLVFMFGGGDQSITTFQ